MRDPDLMQRADRAAIVLEQAWERWRALHGLGAEPLPPVSSYVGYSLEEPWGQPRVVFGLRADEAELLASLLEGHDCVGSVYSEAGARLDWRLPVSGPLSMPGRGYGAPLSVPAQAPPLGSDPLSDPADGFAIGSLADEDAPPGDEPDDESGRSLPIRGGGAGSSARSRSARAARPGRPGRRTAESVADDAPEITDREEAGWPAGDGEPPPVDLDADAEADAPGVAESPPLAPLPDMSELQQRSDDEVSAEPDPHDAGTPNATGGGTGKSRGPGYRGPRYQGVPPRYEAGPRADKPARPAVAAEEDDDDGADLGAEPASSRRTHVAKLSRSARRRTQGG